MRYSLYVSVLLQGDGMSASDWSPSIVVGRFPTIADAVLHGQTHIGKRYDIGYGVYDNRTKKVVPRLHHQCN